MALVSRVFGTAAISKPQGRTSLLEDNQYDEVSQAERGVPATMKAVRIEAHQKGRKQGPRVSIRRRPVLGFNSTSSI